MNLPGLLSLGQTALELGLTCSLTVLALFLSYSMLNVCDLSTDGCFTLGATIGAVIAIAGHPFLSPIAAMTAGACSGLITAILQTRLGVDSLLSGIIVNTASYSVNIAIMGSGSFFSGKGNSLIEAVTRGASDLNMNKTETVFTLAKKLLENTPFAGQYKLFVVLIAVMLAVLVIVLFLNTRLGLAIRATGDNPDMVRSSSINPAFTTTVGLCIANAFTGLSGCLLAQYQKSADINIGTGMVTIALASLLIGCTIVRRGTILARALSMVAGALIFRLVYTIALRLNMPAFLLKLVSSVIVVLAVSIPYIMQKWPTFCRRMNARKGGKASC